MLETEGSPEAHSPEEQTMLEAKESPEANTPEEHTMLEAEESPEAHTPEQQRMLDASGTTGSAIGSQDRTGVRQARAIRRKERQREKLRTEESVEARRMTRSMARGNASAAMMMTNAPIGSEGDPLTYREAMGSPENWQRAIQEEYEAIIHNKTFEETKEPHNRSYQL